MVTISDAIRRLTEERLRRLERFELRPARVEVMFETERGAKKVEAHVTVLGGGQFTARSSAGSYPVAIGMTLERLARQLKRNRELQRAHQAAKPAP